MGEVGALRGWDWPGLRHTTVRSSAESLNSMNVDTNIALDISRYTCVYDQSNPTVDSSSDDPIQQTDLRDDVIIKYDKIQ